MQAIVRIAERQRGLATRGQLLAIGWSSTTIARRVRDGWLQRVHPGVYVVGPRVPSPEARMLAAVLACGAGTDLSHWAAGAVWGVRPRASRIDVTVAGSRGRRISGIVAHRAQLLPSDRAVVDGLPVTSVARTLLDLAPLLSPRQLDATIERAEQLRVFDGLAVEDVLGRNRGHRGRGPLRRALERAHGDTGRSRSELERRARALFVDAGLPAPSVNAVVRGFEVDLAWLRERVVVELDGWEHHRGRSAFERDRRRDAELQAAGYRVARFTWRQLRDDPAWVVENVTLLLGVAHGVHQVGAMRHTT